MPQQEARAVEPGESHDHGPGPEPEPRGAPPDEPAPGSGDGQGPPAVPALSVAGAARGLGVAAATLRSWERRYGLSPSLHTPGGHRRYGPDDLARLRIMHRLVHEGVPPAEAARVAIHSSPHSPSQREDTGPFQAVLDDAIPLGIPLDEGSAAPLLDGAPVGAPPLGDVDVAAPPGGGRVLAMPRRSPSARGLARSAMALDAASCRRTLVAALADRGTVATWEELICPVLASIGDRWEATGSGVEVEHSFSVVVGAVLGAHSGRLTRARNDRPVLLASVPDELHDLPLLAIQAALSDISIRSHVVGARTPRDALADAVTRLGPAVVFLWAQMPTDVHPHLPALRPAPILLVGGPGWRVAPEGAMRPKDLGGAVRAICDAMAL